MADRLFWPSWFVAVALAGIVTGFMLGHALILGRFLDRMLASATPGSSPRRIPRSGRAWGARGSMSTTWWAGCRC